MKDIHEWLTDQSIDQLSELYNLGKAARGIGATSNTETYDSRFYALLARPISRLVQMEIDRATRQDPTIADDHSKLALIKQGIIRDILAVASNIVTNGMGNASRTRTNFRAVGSNLTNPK